jgi:hypothetical protein
MLRSAIRGREPLGGAEDRGRRQCRDDRSLRLPRRPTTGPALDRHLRLPTSIMRAGRESILLLTVRPQASG